MCSLGPACTTRHGVELQPEPQPESIRWQADPDRRAIRPEDRKRRGDDGEMAAWRAQGAGRFTGHGTAVSWRGAIYYQTNSERLARLNGVAVVYEYETEESGKVAAQFYEWK
jgi:hypothetical protein